MKKKHGELWDRVNELYLYVAKFHAQVEHNYYNERYVNGYPAEFMHIEGELRKIMEVLHNEKKLL